MSFTIDFEAIISHARDWTGADLGNDSGLTSYTDRQNHSRTRRRGRARQETRLTVTGNWGLQKLYQNYCDWPKKLSELIAKWQMMRLDPQPFQSNPVDQSAPGNAVRTRHYHCQECPSTAVSVAPGDAWTGTPGPGTTGNGHRSGRWTDPTAAKDRSRWKAAAGAGSVEFDPSKWPSNGRVAGTDTTNARYWR